MFTPKENRYGMLLVLLNVLDAVLTQSFLVLGGKEINPFFADSFNSTKIIPFDFILIKLGVAVFCFLWLKFALWGLRRENKNTKYAFWLIKGVNIYYLVVVVNNLLAVCLLLFHM